MELNVVNCGLHVGYIDVTGLTTSSLLLVGDADIIQMSSFFDTPPESLIIGTLEQPSPVENR